MMQHLRMGLMDAYLLTRARRLNGASLDETQKTAADVVFSSSDSTEPPILPRAFRMGGRARAQGGARPARATARGREGRDKGSTGTRFAG
jgi:hypothetical protein